jgi:hypothetical protein
VPEFPRLFKYHQRSSTFLSSAEYYLGAGKQGLQSQQGCNNTTREVGDDIVNPCDVEHTIAKKFQKNTARRKQNKSCKIGLKELEAVGTRIMLDLATGSTP